MAENLNAADPYDVLGVTHETSEAEIKQRARDLLDAYSDDHAAQKRITEAFEELMDRPRPLEVDGTTVVPILVSATPETVAVGDEVTVKVTDHRGGPLSGASIHVDGQVVGRTDGDGRETLRLNDAGVVGIRARVRHPEADREFRDDHVKVVVDGGE